MNPLQVLGAVAGAAEVVDRGVRAVPQGGKAGAREVSCQLVVGGRICGGVISFRGSVDYYLWYRDFYSLQVWCK